MHRSDDVRTDTNFEEIIAIVQKFEKNEKNLKKRLTYEVAFGIILNVFRRAQQT